MMISQSEVLVRLHELLDASLDSSCQELSQNQRKHLQQQLCNYKNKQCARHCCYQLQKFKNTLKNSLEKHKMLEKSHWLADSNIFGKWNVESGK